MKSFEIRKDDLTAEATRALLAEHFQRMRVGSPPGHSFALDLAGLSESNVTVWTAWDDSTIAGVAAFNDLGNGFGELKSMRTASSHLRQGVAAKLLAHIIDEARRSGFRRLSLETGRGENFDAAVAFYRKQGFIDGDAFADYVRSDFNQFLHLDL
ncbi:MAG: GNAT family N-acetyltransferase [Woeseiaceae bacterium]